MLGKILDIAGQIPVVRMSPVLNIVEAVRPGGRPPILNMADDAVDFVQSPEGHLLLQIGITAGLMIAFPPAGGAMAGGLIGGGLLQGGARAAVGPVLLSTAQHLLPKLLEGGAPADVYTREPAA